MRFDRPLVLLAVPAVVALVWVVARRGRRPVPVRQHRWAVLARLVTVVLLVAAAAGPHLERSVSTRSVLFMVDRSESIGSEVRSAQEDFLRAVLDEGDPLGRAGIALFGSEVRLDRAVGPVRPFDGIRTEVDGSATDLAAAMMAADSLLPTEGSRRVVILTDAVPTTTGVTAASERLAESGVAVDFVTFGTAQSADLLVESVQVPASTRQGDDASVTAMLRSNQSGDALVTFRTADGTEIVREISVDPGRNEVTVQVPSPQPGFEIVTVTARAGFDTRPENDTSSGVYRVLGPARVAVVEGVAGDADDLARALEAGGVAIDVRATVPSEQELLGYDAVILVNLSRPSDAEGAALASFVEDLGRGLVVVGGDRAFGMGDYHETPLEAVLPVSSNPDDLIRRQPVAEVLVIDSSGSMGACHCREGGFDEGGVVKTDIARAGAASAVEALSPEDSVGVVTVSSGIDWVLPLQSKPDTDTVTEALNPIAPDGETKLILGLEAALEELQGVEGALRHIVVFTDGWDSNEANLVPMARRIADAGVTLSVLGTGEGSGATLRRMADIGGGRFYPGQNLASIPEIFVEETLMAARGLINEGDFVATLGAPSPVTEGLESAPPLRGYVATKAKATASTSLLIGPGDPLLASWQRGLGRATAWTSDATARWSAGWVTWEGYVDFWGRTLRQVLPSGLDVPPEVTIDSGTLGVTFDVGEPVLDGAAIARVRTPNGDIEIVALAQTGESTFAGSTTAADPGAYWVAVSLERADGSGLVSSAGAVSGYAEEFAFRAPDLALVASVAEMTGGRMGIEAAMAFDEAPAQGAALQAIAVGLVGLALMLFLFDVALRRLVFSTEDATEWRQGVQTERRRERRRIEQVMTGAATDRLPPPVVSDSETLERLMRRKRR
ncbi:VWA domain-containing protein [soil metagenome]